MRDKKAMGTHSLRCVVACVQAQIETDFSMFLIFRNQCDENMNFSLTFSLPLGTSSAVALWGWMDVGGKKGVTCRTFGCA